MSQIFSTKNQCIAKLFYLSISTKSKIQGHVKFMIYIKRPVFKSSYKMAMTLWFAQPGAGQTRPLQEAPEKIL